MDMDKRGLRYLAYVDAAGEVTYWLAQRLTDAWTIAYRLTYTGTGVRRRARIHEARIVACGVEAFTPDQWHSATTPFSFDRARRGMTARRFADALAAVVGELPHNDAVDEQWAEMLGHPAASVEKPPRAPAIGRPGRPRSFYAEVAMRYHHVEHVARREPGASTRGTLARHYKVNVTAIGKWLQTARRYGLLTPVVPGQRGSMATNLAKQLSEWGKK